MPIVDGSISSIHISSGKHTNPIENGPIEIDDFPIKNGDVPTLFHSYGTVYQRVFYSRFFVVFH